MLSDSNPLRKLIVRAVVHPAFDRFILAVILLNAAVMGMADYTRVGLDPRRDDYGSPVAEGPWNPFVMIFAEAEEGLWTKDYGLWTMDYRSWFMEDGLWNMDHGLSSFCFSL